MLKRSTFREIKDSLGRFLAILAIVALGVGFFAGLKVTKEAMLETTEAYLNEENFYDFQIQSTLGLTEEDRSVFAKVKGIADAEGDISYPALYHLENDDSEAVMAFHQLPETINKVSLKKGRFPRGAEECAVDYALLGDIRLGDVITLTENNEKETLDAFAQKKYTVVGFVSSPLYLNFERGNTSLGNGSVKGFAYLSEEGFDTDYYTSIYLTLKQHEPIYSDAYDHLADKYQKTLENLAEERGRLRYEDIVGDAKASLAEGQGEYNRNYQKYRSEKASAQKELQSSYAQLREGSSQLKAGEDELTQKQEELNTSFEQVTEGLTAVGEQRSQLEAAKETMEEEDYAAAVAQLDSTEEALQQQKAQIEGGLEQISAGLAALAEEKNSLEGGYRQYYAGKAKAEAGFRDAESQLADAQKKLDDAAAEIEDIATADTYVLGRDTNTGYLCFESDAEIVNSIAKVFPVFFFLVAALVCMTTMSRMVDEQRTQIGILKALGYRNGAIAGKFLFYAGSAAFLGCAIGFFGGCYLFPKVIWYAYGMMYDFNVHLRYVINVPLGLLSLGVSLLCSMGVALYCCLDELREVPAQLIRPKAPKNGKRILLERFTFFWSRLGFLYKVSFRNIFRYKKRFFMMVVGISGCTALLLAGLGIQDTIKNVVNFQYDEIQLFDYSVTFDEDMDARAQQSFLEDYSEYLDEVLFVHQGSYDLIYGRETKAVNIVIAEDKRFPDFVSLHRHDGTEITYPQDGEVVICKNLADEYHLKVGDTVTFRNEDHREMTAAVSDICENFIYNYVYAASADYEKGFCTAPTVKTAYVDVGTDDVDSIYQSSAKILGDDRVLTVGVNDEMRQRVNNMMESLNYVVLLVIFSAGALAFIVLYNLTNINIRERMREIATIKVLGFFPRETSLYVFRENVFLTAISAVCGLFLGRLLLNFIISKIQIDLIYFDPRISVLSYVLAVVLTFVFALLVNLVMTRKLEKISMVESLKSIE